MRTTSDAKGPIFLHEVAPGITDTNYALEVASSAGIPMEVIAAASQVGNAFHKLSALRIHTKHTERI